MMRLREVRPKWRNRPFLRLLLVTFVGLLVQMRAPLLGNPSCVPHGVHLAQATNLNGDNRVDMTVSFLVCSPRDRPLVYYGRGLSVEGKVEALDPVRFKYTSSKSNGLFRSDWIYHVVLPNLQAGLESYWYKIVLDTASLRGQEARFFQFLTPPFPGSPTTLALVGDLGQTENSTRTMDHIREAQFAGDVPVSQLLIAGDMSYADSDPERWKSWFNVMEPMLATLPTQVAAGNHEIECDETSNDIFVPYENYFRNPNRLAPADMEPVSGDYRKTLWHHSCSAPSVFQGHYNFGNAFYSYEHGLAKIVVLSSYSDATEGSVQYEWLRKELEQVDRSRTPWLLVSFHSPLYTTFLGHIDEIEAVNMRTAMEPLFLQYKVNLVISGHDHAYMRTKHMFQGKVDPEGLAPIYLSLGMGGNREQHSAGYRQLFPEEWVEKRSLADYGYGLLRIPNATHARFHWIRDYTTHYGIHDDAWISNPHVPPSFPSMQ